MKLSRFFIGIVFLLTTSVLFAQSYMTSAYFDKLNKHLKSFERFNEEISTYCENSQQNIIPVLASDNLVEIGFEQYQLNDIAKEYYQGFQSMDYVDKCRLLYSWNQYSTIIYDIARDKGIPSEIAYLPVAYTALDKFYSGSDYRFGLWGLPYLPAVKYGIVADSCYDQRLDISLNSYAALSYLDDLHRSFTTWDMAVTAYCCGPTSLVRAGYGEYDFDTVYNNLNCNDKDCFYRLLAFSKWIEENETIDFENVGGFSMSVSDTIIITSRVHFSQISEVLKISKNELRLLNPLFVGDVIDGRKKSKVINLPESYKNSYLTLRDSIENYMDSVYFPKHVPVVPKSNGYANNTYVSASPGDDFEEIKYKIVSGDNLGAIAERYDVKVSELQSWNDIKGVNIWAGQQISIWVKKGTKQQYEQKETEKETVTVKKETPSSTIDTKTVKKGMSLDDYRFVATYEVKSGDSPYSIAQNYSWASPEDIMDWNGIDNPSKIQIGQKLKIYRKKK